MSEKQIELITKKNNSIEITEEALNFLLSLKTEKILILSVIGSSNEVLSNKIISKNKDGFNLKEENIYLWNKPLNLNNENKLLIIAYNGNKNSNLFLLNLLISSFCLYNTPEDLNDENINSLVSDLNIKELINSKNKEYTPNIFFVNEKLNEDEIKTKIEVNSEFKKNNLNSIYNTINYLQFSNSENLIKVINKEISSLKNTFIKKSLEGESLFGLIQNIINSINHEEKIDIDLSYENIFLNKARKEYNKTFEEYKLDLYKKVEYPITFQNLYKINSDLLNIYISSFCHKINLYLTPSQMIEYTNEFNISSEKEINYILNKNNDYYETYYLTQFSEFEKNLEYNFDFTNNKLSLNDFIKDYCGKFDTCLLKFFNSFLNSENNSNKVFANILIKMYQEYFVKKLILISEKIDEKNSLKNNELNEQINELKNKLEKTKEEIDNTKLILESKNKEKSDINKNYFELETKFDKFNRDYKLKLKENENTLTIETQKYSKMENYYLSQLKEKEKLINSLENKIEKINKEMQTLTKENTIKINELNRENNRLLNEIERIKEIKNKSGDYGISTGGDKNINVGSILKTVNKSFLDFKESVENLKNENDSIQKNKYLELTKEEIETKLNNVLNDVKNFCSLQIKTVSDNYEKLIKKAKSDFEELNFESSKKDFALNEQILLKETYEKKYNESNKSIESYKSMTQDKENLINTQKESFKVYENRINDLEIKLAENIYNLRMKEDEFDSLIMILQYIFEKKRDKFEQNLNKISPDSQQFLQGLVKKYKIFK